MTNGDKIRQMTDEEIARWLYSYDCCNCRYVQDDLCGTGKNAWLDWLKQEVEELQFQRLCAFDLDLQAAAAIEDLLYKLCSLCAICPDGKRDPFDCEIIGTEKIGGGEDG